MLFDPNDKMLEIVKGYFDENPDVMAEEILFKEREKNVILLLPTILETLKILKRESFSNAKLSDVHRIFKKWFEINDMNRIDVILAVALSQKMKGTPLWLILVAPSGDMKSEQLMALDDDNKITKLVHKFTDKTLVNGFNNKAEHPDFAPKLDEKIMIIIDMAEILQLPPNIKNEVWGQLRQLYDGFAGAQSGMGTDVSYKGLRVTFIGASTPAIDEQILIHQSLGTRELIYRPKELVDRKKLMEKVLFNEQAEEQMREELKAVCQGFLEKTTLKNIFPTEMAIESIMALADYLTYMRAAGPTDSYTGDLRGNVHPEMPTRILKQFVRMYRCLLSLDENYSENKALEIIKETVMSSVDIIRVKVFETLLKYDGKITTTEISNTLRIGKKSAKTELNILWNMGLINRNCVETTNQWGSSYIVQEEWFINNDHDVVKRLKKSPFLLNNIL